jgi:hypothetical protein
VDNAEVKRRRADITSYAGARVLSLPTLELAVETVKPFEQQELHRTVTIRPE